MVEQRRVGLTVDERIGIGPPVAGLGQVRRIRKPPPGHLIPVHAFAARAGAGREFRRARRAGRNEIARPPARGQIVARHQLGIGERHGDAADAQMVGQPPAGRQPLAGAEAARKDAVRHHLPDLLLQRAAGAGGQEEVLDGYRHVWPQISGDLALSHFRSGRDNSLLRFRPAPPHREGGGSAPAVCLSQRPWSAPCRSSR